MTPIDPDESALAEPEACLQPELALVRQPVALVAAVGLIWQSHFNQSSCQCRLEVGIAKVILVL